jgi:hypothetical protein
MEVDQGPNWGCSAKGKKYEREINDLKQFGFGNRNKEAFRSLLITYYPFVFT